MAGLPMNAQQILNREFLEIRCKILEVAAALDRLDRAEGVVADDPRLKKLHDALEVVNGDVGDRAEQVQLIFSRSYDEDWQRTFSVGRRAK